MICTKRQEIKRQSKEGTTTFFKCINCLSDNFKKPVEKETCEQCPLKQMKTLGGCSRRKPCSVKMVKGLLVYPGPCPDGFEETEGGFKNLWPECVQALTNNTVSREGEFIPVIYCANKNKIVNYSECSKCHKELKHLSEKRTIDPEELKKAIAEQAPKMPEEQNKSMPALNKQVKNYSKAIYNWVTNGMESRPKEEVEEIFGICKACEFFNEGRCAVCGCRLASNGVAVTNKIKMASEHCPKGKW